MYFVSPGQGASTPTPKGGFTLHIYPGILGVTEKNNPENTRVIRSVHTALLRVGESPG